jgi:PadR family transcriptional regulator, regulatory protein PadR
MHLGVSGEKSLVWFVPPEGLCVYGCYAVRADAPLNGSFGYNSGVAAAPKPSPAAMLILRAIADGPVYVYGLRVIQITGLPSGTVYPAMRRLERDGLIQSHLEQQSIADAEQRPLRKYYKLTRTGRKQLRPGMEDPKSLNVSQDGKKRPATPG